MFARLGRTCFDNVASAPKTEQFWHEGEEDKKWSQMVAAKIILAMMSTALMRKCSLQGHLKDVLNLYICNKGSNSSLLYIFHLIVVSATNAILYSTELESVCFQSHWSLCLFIFSCGMPILL